MRGCAVFRALSLICACSVPETIKRVYAKIGYAICGGHVWLFVRGWYCLLSVRLLPVNALSVRPADIGERADSPITEYGVPTTHAHARTTHHTCPPHQ